MQLIYSGEVQEKGDAKMLLGSILNATGSLLGVGGSGAVTKPAAAQSTQPTPPPATPPAESGGVTFDFSKAVLDDLAPAADAGTEAAPAAASSTNTPETAAPPVETPADGAAAAAGASVAAPVVQGSATGRGAAAAPATEAASDTSLRRTASVGNASDEERIRAWAIGMLARERLGSLPLTPAKASTTTAALQAQPAKSLAGESANLNAAPSPRTLART
ncbi:hypothetical protein [Paracoccus aminovorans]|nr:hypothetical protein [Paracoccus aminovorans]